MGKEDTNALEKMKMYHTVEATSKLNTSKAKNELNRNRRLNKKKQIISSSNVTTTFSQENTSL